MKKHSQLWVFFHGLYYNNFILAAKEAQKMTVPSSPVSTATLEEIIGGSRSLHDFHRLFSLVLRAAPEGAVHGEVRLQLIGFLNHRFGTYALITNGDVRPKYFCGYDEAKAKATKGDIIAMLVSGDGLESHFGAAIRFLTLFPKEEELVQKLLLARLKYLRISNAEINARHFISQAAEHLKSVGRF